MWIDYHLQLNTTVARQGVPQAEEMQLMGEGCG